MSFFHGRALPRAVVQLRAEAQALQNATVQGAAMLVVPGARVGQACHCQNIGVAIDLMDKHLSRILLHCRYLKCYRWATTFCHIASRLYLCDGSFGSLYQFLCQRNFLIPSVICQRCPWPLTVKKKINMVILYRSHHCSNPPVIFVKKPPTNGRQ